MELYEQVSNLINDLRNEYFTVRMLCAILNVNSSHGRHAVSDILARLTQEGRIIYDKRNARYRNTKEGELGKAVFCAHPKGYGFLLMDEGEDLFVPASRTNGAFHHDTVLYRKKDGRKGEAEVIRVLQRGMTYMAGVFVNDGGGRFVVPDEQRFVADIYIPPKRDMGARNGQKVAVRITHYPTDNRNNPEGEVVQILGYPDEKDVDMLSVATNYGLSQVFPPEVEARAEAIAQSVSESELTGRTDLRGEVIFTVDGEDARDLDDAVSIVEQEDGTYILGVHIADVSHYVSAGGDIDKEAFRRGTSVYLPQMVFPMLPKTLSNGICSLYEGVDRLTLTCRMRIDGRGKVLECDIFPSVIRSKHRMTYTAVQAILDGDMDVRAQYADIVSDIEAMARLTRILETKRERRGNIDFVTEEPLFVHDEHGEVVDIRLAEHSFAHKIIEEFMIAANESVAQYATDCGYPCMYRVHAKPDGEKLKALYALMRGLGLDVKRTRESHNSVLQKGLSLAKDTPYFRLVNDVMLRTMQKAKYSDVNTGHFGLAAECYCHFTSPIRRYPDLTVHRIIKTAIAGKMTDKAIDTYINLCRDAAPQCNLTEKNADEAERRADDVKKCAYAARLIGCTFEAYVSGVTERGIYAQLPNTVEGFIPIEQLGCTEFDPENFCLYGDGVRIRLGDAVTVRVASVNRQACKIDFDIVPHDDE